MFQGIANCSCPSSLDHLLDHCQNPFYAHGPWGFTLMSALPKLKQNEDTLFLLNFNFADFTFLTFQWNLNFTDLTIFLTIINVIKTSTKT